MQRTLQNFMKIEDGELLGQTLFTDNGKEYEAYRRIPYAKPPIGSLRFQPPEPPKPWSGIRNATERSPICIQNVNMINQFDIIVQGEEDCLYVDVYKPKKISKLLPVMVHIHGGGFKLSSSSFCDPVYFMDHEIVVVMIQYRLHAFGFLSTNDEVMPGNVGMKDQVAALKWVQKNIAAFGGNPGSVTLVGNSAGGVSVHFHLFSPLSKGLFHRAICQSGNAFIAGAFSTAEISKKKTIFLAESVQCPTKSSRKLMECLEKVPAELITIMHERLYLWPLQPLIMFPIVNEPVKEGAFITEFPQHIINNVPLIIGANSGDGIIKLSSAYNNPIQFEIMRKDFQRSLPHVFEYRLWIDDEKQLLKIAESLLNYYFHGEEIGMETLDEWIEVGKLKKGEKITEYVFFNDGVFVVSSIETARIMQKEPAYLYFNEHRNEYSYCDVVFRLPQNATKKKYTCHADDLISFCYLPEMKYQKFKNGSNDYQVSQRLIKYWINFIHEGNPNREHELWKPMKSNQLDYLHITTLEDRMEKGLKNRSYDLWNKLGLIVPRKQELNLKDEF